VRALRLETDGRVLVAEAQKCMGKSESARASYLDAAVVAARSEYDEELATIYLRLEENATNDKAYAEAERWSAQATEAITRLPGNVGLQAMLKSTDCYLDLERDQPVKAEQHCSESLALFKRLPTRRRDEADTMHLLAIALMRQAHYPEAAEQVRNAEQEYAQLLGPDSYDESRMLWTLAGIEEEQDHIDTALALFKRVLKFMEPDSPDGVSLTLTSYGALLIDAGQAQEAVPPLQRALAAAQKAERHDYQEAIARSELGRAYLMLGQLPAAYVELDKAWRANAHDEPDRALLGFDLARAMYEVTPEHARALAIARQSREFLATHPKGAYRERRLRELDAWLAAHAPKPR
jgi:tetratricopeptide (TPR) repeat protein